MIIYDISLTLSEDMLKYPSLQKISHVFEKDYSRGDSFALSRINMQMHLGSHVDAPYHFINGGKRIDEMPIETFCGDIAVIEANHLIIDAADIAKIPPDCKRVVFKTPHSTAMHFSDASAEPSYFSEDASILLASLGMLLVGIDSFSVDKPSTGKAAHMNLLGAGIALLEGIDLYFVSGGEYIINCAPLKINNAEAAPCRAVLISKN